MSSQRPPTFTSGGTVTPAGSPRVVVVGECVLSREQIERVCVPAVSEVILTRQQIERIRANGGG